MAKYKVPVYWQMCGYIEVEAEDEASAISVAEENLYDCPLPDDSEYVDGSFEIDASGIVFEV